MLMRGLQVKVGDKVSYEAVGGGAGTTTSETTGVVIDILTEPQVRSLRTPPPSSDSIRVSRLLDLRVSLSTLTTTILAS